jgi:hypothetical protein
MYIIDLTLKNNPLALSVQRKLADDAEQVYQQVMKAIQSGSPEMLELSCEFQPGKRLAIKTSELTAVQISEKSSTTAASGRPPGFLSIAQ